MEFQELAMRLESSKELKVKEISVDLVLDVLWELLQNLLILGEFN